MNSIPATSATMGAVSGQIESDVAAHYFPPRPKEELAPGLTYQPVGPLNLLDIVPKQLRFQVSTGQVLVVTPFPGQAPRTQKSSPVF